MLHLDFQREPIWKGCDDMLHVARLNPRSEVLGPGRRAVVWVQGCAARCPGCVVPEWLPFQGGEKWRVEELAEWLLSLSEIEGVTFSGGEPMMQAAALVRVLELVRERRDLGCVVYSGFTLEYLVAKGHKLQHRLLEMTDLLIDGPYLESRHTDLRWRGSDNQRIHFLGDRYAAWKRRTEDRGSWLEMEITPEGNLVWSGIPPARFREGLSAGLAEQGIMHDAELATIQLTGDSP